MRTEVIASGLGPSAPVSLLGQNFITDKFGEVIAPRYMLQPTVHAGVSSGATLTYRFEVTSDAPDASGNWPSPGNWIPIWDESGVHSVSDVRRLLVMVSGVRVNVLSYGSGSVALRVLQ